MTKKYELWEGNVLIGVFTAAEIADRTDVTVGTVYTVKSSGVRFARRYTVKDVEGAPAGEMLNVYKDGGLIASGTAKELAGRFGITYDTIRRNVRERLTTKNGWQFRRAESPELGIPEPEISEPEAPRKKSLTELDQEARDHGMSYGQYIAWMENQK